MFIEYYSMIDYNHQKQHSDYEPDSWVIIHNTIDILQTSSKCIWCIDKNHFNLELLNICSKSHFVAIHNIMSFNVILFNLLFVGTSKYLSRTEDLIPKGYIFLMLFFMSWK